MCSLREVSLMGHWRQANTGVQRYERVASSVPVRISTVDPEIDPASGNSFFRSAEETTANLSQGGAYLKSWEPLAAGRRVIVGINLLTGEELQLTARVVWTRRELRPTAADKLEEAGYGVEFYGLSSREFSTLHQLMDSLSTKSKSTQQSAATSPTPHL
ncbi:MAG TPA: PilZ domain-containing protein [Myxococcales bacterium]|nr:PilZ domain-containing protein [Myxococcales bacterium]HIK85315.1 PilZ domain-containing protein [Myxococcales bacterium]